MEKSQKSSQNIEPISDIKILNPDIELNVDTDNIDWTNELIWSNANYKILSRL